LPPGWTSGSNRVVNDALSDPHPQVQGRTALIIPAFNEEEALGFLLEEVCVHVPHLDVIVVNDGSMDNTAGVARRHGATVLDLPCNLGVGGAVQAGFRFAYEHGYQYAVRIDGDGQHPPAEIPKLLAVMEESGADLVTGSRFLGDQFYTSTWFRCLGIRMLALLLSIICRNKVTDPTSGFWMVNRKLLYYFAHHYPTEYPEPEAIALLSRHGFSFQETGVLFRPRLTGTSSIRTWGTVYYMIKVGLALVIDRIKPIESRFVRSRLPEGL
jgi:glycosyltransferase involved in cell wall biosynthesis